MGKLSVVTALAVSGRTLLLPFRGWRGHFGAAGASLSSLVTHGLLV
jgi:hypothetical protein